MNNAYLFVALAIAILALILVRAVRRVSQAKSSMGDYISPEYVDSSDPMAQVVIARAFNSGKIIRGSRDEDGNVTITDEDGNETFTEGTK